MNRFVTKRAQGRFQPAAGPGMLCGTFVQLSDEGLATRIEPVRVGARLQHHVPVLDKK